MAFDLHSLIDDLANRADDLLAGIRDRKEARASLAEVLASDYPTLDPDARTAIIDGVIQLLEEDDFFGIEFVGDPFSETSDD